MNSRQRIDPPNVKIRSYVLIGSALLFASLAGCSDDKAPDTDHPSPNAGYTAPSFEDMPDCAEVSALLGDLVAGLIPAEGDEYGPYNHDTQYGTSCVWLTQESQSSNAFEAIKAGSFGITIVVEQSPPIEADLRSLGWVYDDSRVEAINGFVVDPTKKLDLSAPVAVIGPHVVVGNTSIIFAATGVALQHTDGLQHVTNDRAIDAGVRLQKSFR